MASAAGLLPDLHGRRVVDLGCGFGWFCRWAHENGAAQIFGLDVSENMLARARSASSDAAITYAKADLEKLDLPESAFDLVYSSLALHYIRDLAGLFATVYRALVPGGHLVFSMEHPIYTAPTHPGWSVDANGRKTWPVDRYLVEGCALLQPTLGSAEHGNGDGPAPADQSAIAKRRSTSRIAAKAALWIAEPRSSLKSVFSTAKRQPARMSASVTASAAIVARVLIGLNNMADLRADMLFTEAQQDMAAETRSG